MPRKDIDWPAVRGEWEAGQLSVAEIARRHGITDSSIFKRAERHRWPKRTPVIEHVRHVVRAGDGGEGRPDIRTSLTVFQRAMGLLVSHRRDLATIRGMMEGSLSRAGAIVERRQASGRPLNLGEEALVMGLLKDAANLMARLVPLERRAFGFTDADGPSEFDGLTEAELAELESTIRRVIGP